MSGADQAGDETRIGVRRRMLIRSTDGTLGARIATTVSLWGTERFSGIDSPGFLNVTAVLCSFLRCFLASVLFGYAKGILPEADRWSGYITGASLVEMPLTLYVTLPGVLFAARAPSQ